MLKCVWVQSCPKYKADIDWDKLVMLTEEQRYRYKKVCTSHRGRYLGYLLGVKVSDLDQFEEPTADAEAPEPGALQPGQPGQTPGGQTPGGTGGGGQV